MHGLSVCVCVCVCVCHTNACIRQSIVCKRLKQSKWMYTEVTSQSWRHMLPIWLSQHTWSSKDVLGLWMSIAFSLMMLTLPTLFDTSRSTSILVYFFGKSSTPHTAMACTNLNIIISTNSRHYNTAMETARIKGNERNTCKVKLLRFSQRAKITRPFLSSSSIDHTHLTNWAPPIKLQRARAKSIKFQNMIIHHVDLLA